MAQTETAAKDARSEAFVKARRAGEGIPVYPGDMPQTLEEAYKIQDSGISLWPSAIKGWKVGRVAGEWETKLGVDRLVGPVFEELCFDNHDDVHTMPVFGKGFAAVEGEVTAVIGKDVPEGKTDFTTEEALGFIKSLHFGVEIAS